jgi:hypothetical protein
MTSNYDRVVTILPTVINKSYLLFISRNYRLIIFKFKEILQLLIQFVFLTRTFLLYLEQSFKKKFLIKDLTIIKSFTTRSNISYQAQPYKSNKKEGQFLEIKDSVNQ